LHNPARQVGKPWIDPIPAKIFEDSFAKASLPERKFVMDGISWQHSRSTIIQLLYFKIIGSIGTTVAAKQKLFQYFVFISLLEPYHAQDGAFPEFSPFPIDNWIHPGKIQDSWEPTESLADA
jgi:hypothetical protein